MSQAKTHLMQVAIKTGNKTLIAKLALLDNVEKNSHGGVFLDNAYGQISKHLTPIEWRQALSALALQGFYKASQDPEFKGRYGYVVTDKE